MVALCSDIYDKLQILRTLRPRLAGALFLTNGLDARYSHPTEWEETRNLIVATSYPLRVEWADAGARPLPFRDSSQTALYAAARTALHPTKQPPIKDRRGRTQLYEIGKSGPFLLREAHKANPLLPPLHWRKTPELPLPHWLPISMAASILLIMALLLLRQARHSSTTPLLLGFRRLGGWVSRTELAVPAALIMSIGITYGRYRWQEPSQAEPFSFYDGLSNWPGDFVRLFTLFLAIHFICKILIELESNAQKLAEDFGLKAKYHLPPATLSHKGAIPSSGSRIHRIIPSVGAGLNDPGTTAPSAYPSKPAPPVPKACAACAPNSSCAAPRKRSARTHSKNRCPTPSPSKRSSPRLKTSGRVPSSGSGSSPSCAPSSSPREAWASGRWPIFSPANSRLLTRLPGSYCCGLGRDWRNPCRNRARLLPFVDRRKIA